MSNIKVGDRIVYRPAFGSEPPTVKTVEGLTLTRGSRSKYGEQTESVTWEQIKANRVLFSLGGHWCYSDQVCKEETLALTD